MRLLDGAAITIRREDDGTFTAMVIVGYTSSVGEGDTPELAIGRAVMKQANLTPAKVKKLGRDW